MAINDYRCADCGFEEYDLIADPKNCAMCDGLMYVNFSYWKGLEIDPRHDERLDSKGFVKKFGLLDDPLASAQLGMGDPKLQSYNRLSEEEQKVYKERLILDGDSPKLRKDVLKAYNKNIGSKYEVQED